MNIGSWLMYSLDISQNIALETLRLWESPISTLDIASNTNLNSIHLENNAFTSSTLDMFIADLLANVQANPRSGAISIEEHELPSASGIADLETLRDDYGWTFNYSLATKSAKTMGGMFSEDFIKESLERLK